MVVFRSHDAISRPDRIVVMPEMARLLRADGVFLELRRHHGCCRPASGKRRQHVGFIAPPPAPEDRSLRHPRSSMDGVGVADGRIGLLSAVSIRPLKAPSKLAVLVLVHLLRDVPGATTTGKEARGERTIARA